MKKTDTINFIIDVPLYPGDVMVSINQPKSDLIKAIKKWKDLPEHRRVQFLRDIETHNDDDAHGTAYHIEGSTFMILTIYEPVITPFQHSHLGHEVFHICEFIMETAGVGHCRESSEAFAYLISYIIEEIYKRIL